MGRRGKNHASVKFIILVDKYGNENQRIELDDTGRLLHKYPNNRKININPQFPHVQPQPPNSIHSKSNILTKLDIPIPPVLRSKPYFNMFNFGTQINHGLMSSNTAQV